MNGEQTDPAAIDDLKNQVRAQRRRDRMISTAGVAVSLAAVAALGWYMLTSGEEIREGYETQVATLQSEAELAEQARQAAEAEAERVAQEKAAAEAEAQRIAQEKALAEGEAERIAAEKARVEEEKRQAEADRAVLTNAIARALPSDGTGPSGTTIGNGTAALAPDAYASLATEIDRYVGDLKQAAGEAPAMREEVVVLRRDVETLTGTVAELERTNEMLKERSVTRERFEQAAKEAARWKQRHRAFQTNARREIARLQADRAKAQDTAAALERRVATMRRTIAQLERRLRTAPSCEGMVPRREMQRLESRYREVARQLRRLQRVCPR